MATCEWCGNFDCAPGEWRCLHLPAGGTPPQARAFEYRGEWWTSKCQLCTRFAELAVLLHWPTVSENYSSYYRHKAVEIVRRCTQKAFESAVKDYRFPRDPK